MKVTLAATMTMGAARETTVAAASICIGSNHDDGYGGSTATIAWSIRTSLVDPVAATIVRTATVVVKETMSSAREAIVTMTMTTMVVATARVTGSSRDYREIHLILLDRLQLITTSYWIGCN
jgi:hypothetical protein